MEQFEPGAVMSNYVMDSFDTIAMVVCLTLLFVCLIVGWIGGKKKNGDCT